MSNGTLKVGSLVYATEQGLGRLAKSFYDAGILTDVCIIWHSKRQNHTGWYPTNTPVVQLNRDGIRGTHTLREFCRSVDVLLCFETPFEWHLFDHCRSVDTKTVLMPMYECMPAKWPAKPDAVLNPSLLDQQYYPYGTHIPIPVKVPWKQRGKLHTFVHNAGNGGLRGRNGTELVLQALPMVKSDCKLIVRSQVNLDVPEAARNDPRLDLRIGTFPHDTLYDEGEAYLFPEKFNGLSLPLQEAQAAGMLVMATDRFPNNTYLPELASLKVDRTEQVRIAHHLNEFTESWVSPQHIAEKMDALYSIDLTTYSKECRNWAREHSWEQLKPAYRTYLEQLVEN